ncbi:hypothetical protein D623_10023910 [Myotis brandtii]|uniref:Uncharacterized protein n=1 Tax=Myotis brandtii TaxID=109478 RepID=S7PU92_MYOBR|nr:hypothetical protein D623_10023910 [Myotis brandtii]
MDLSFTADGGLENPTFAFCVTLGVPETPAPVAPSKAKREQFGSDHELPKWLMARRSVSRGGCGVSRT